MSLIPKIIVILNIKIMQYNVMVKNDDRNRLEHKEISKILNVVVRLVYHLQCRSPFGLSFTNFVLNAVLTFVACLFSVNYKLIC
jgi:hypothetical protein